MLIAPLMSVDNMITQGLQGQVVHSLPRWQEQASWNSSLLPPSLSALKKTSGNLTSCIFRQNEWIEKLPLTQISALPSSTIIRKQNTKSALLWSSVTTRKNTRLDLKDVQRLRICKGPGESSVSGASCARLLILWDRGRNHQL